MTLTDKKIQNLQTVIKENVSLKEGTTFRIPKTNEYYQVVNSIDETTQALAVAPVYSDGQVDYSQTAVVVAGT
ncbi:hypothetical protein AB3329_05610 [Streptococcus sp. H31]|uniref:hypothetical protein n=1 Tax=Streptococcus huangxiaojuni TaxID=3237239 RepID=UPI0034A56396